MIVCLKNKMVWKNNILLKKVIRIKGFIITSER